MNYNINESRRGLNSIKLYQIANEHGGLRPRHGYSFKRFNELTDNDVIGIVDDTELNNYKDASYKTRQQWAINKGFTVNRGDDVTFIPMNDWTWVAVIVRGDMLPDREWAETPYGKKRIERNRNKSQDGARNYIWSDSNTDKEKGLIGWSKRANEFNRMKFNNEINKINENNMSKIVLKEEDLMALVNESVKKVINEAVQNGELDEGFWGNIGQGIKGAFGGDANRVASAVRTGVDKAKNMGQNAYNAVKNAGQKVAGAAKDAYGAVQTGVNQRVNAFKANYAAGQNADKINNVISTLRELQQNGVISGAKTNATINELERLLQMGMKGMRGRATQASNRIGKEE